MAKPNDSEPLDPAFVKLAVVLLVGVVMVVFDSTIVNVAIDVLASGLHTSVSNGQWTISGYVLALGMVVPVSGWASERFGAKQVWMGALALFMVGSILSSAAWDIAALIAFRVLQGIGGGLMLPILQNLLVEAAGGRKLGRIMALISLPTLFGPIVGPVVGGLIVSHLSWRWIFWVNVPFSVAGLVLAWRGLKRSIPRKGAYLDVTGLVLLSPGLAAILYAVTEIGIKGGFGYTAVVAPLAAGLVLLGAFVFHALRTRRPPLVDLRLFKVRSFSAATSLMFLSGFGVFGALLLLPLYYQQVRGQSALFAGLLLAPQGLGMLLTRSKAGSLTDRIGARPIVLAGVVLTAAGTAAYTQVGVHTNEILLGLSLVVRGAGLGAVTIPVMAAAYLGLRPGQVPHASTVTRIAQQVGGSFGTAILAMILSTQLHALGAHGLAGQATAFGTAFWWSLGLTAIAVIPALALPRQRKDQPDVPPPPRQVSPAGRQPSPDAAAPGHPRSFETPKSS
ncbi:MDR family MFS transporter [Trebonia sp.]|uniref:MDR family MFS transporter n=1 Tax=Trebonia sp. TaxID=2767075 RepID=UPI00261375C7|nr:MDR family MFS transporter [Trebonia sp.]